jgi:hypothetical protein
MESYEYWIGTLSSMTLAGPTSTTWEPVVHSGATLTSSSYAGAQFWGPGKPPLLDAVTIHVVPSFSTPPQQPQNTSGNTVDPIGSPWTGLAAESLGNQQLAQTGYDFDTKNWLHGFGNSWYAVVPGLTLPYVNPPVRTGDGVVEATYWCPPVICIWFNAYLFDFVDLTHGFGSTGWLWAAQATPRYALSILEAPRLNGMYVFSSHGDLAPR